MHIIYCITFKSMSRTSYRFSEIKMKSHHGQEIKKGDFRIRIYFAHVLSIRTVWSIYRERLGQTLNSSDVSKIEGTCWRHQSVQCCTVWNPLPFNCGCNGLGLGWVRLIRKRNYNHKHKCSSLISIMTFCFKLSADGAITKCNPGKCQCTESNLRIIQNT